LIEHFYQLEGNRPANKGIGRNGGLTPILQHKTKPGSGQGLTRSLSKSGKFNLQNSKGIRSRADEQSLTPTAPMLQRYVAFHSIK